MIFAGLDREFRLDDLRAAEPRPRLSPLIVSSYSGRAIAGDREGLQDHDQ